MNPAKVFMSGSNRRFFYSVFETREKAFLLVMR